MHPQHMSDLIHMVGVLFVVVAATVYSLNVGDHSGNVWIVYGSAIAFFAGRSGVSAFRSISTGERRTD